MARLYHSLFCLLIPFILIGQFDEYNFYLLDKSTNDPIVGAHYYINNSTISGVSNDEGLCQLNIPASIDGELLITHIAFKTVKVKAKSFLQNIDTIRLNPSMVDFAEITVTAKRSNSWKKNFKKFKKAFLGQNEAAKYCKILNPEVLRFHKDKKGLRATAIDVLQIENKYLGYNIDFLLSHFELERNGSSIYKGYSQYSEFEKVSTKQRKRRTEMYEKSIEKFFKDLAYQELKDFALANLEFVDHNFKHLRSFDFENDIQIDSLTGHYLLAFDQFLGVEHLSLKLVKPNEVGMMRGGQESDKFSTSSGEKGSRIITAKSYLFKSSDYLRLDKYGKLLNKDDIQEFGLWAELKMASTLPMDYILNQNVNKDESLNMLKLLAVGDSKNIRTAIFYFDKKWDDIYTVPLLELLILTNKPEVEQKTLNLLQKKHGKSDMSNYYDGIRWVWLNDISYPEYYPDFKAELYRSIDPIFETYFKHRTDKSIIPFDEILWGGVKQDGIPPLRNPKIMSADDADYLDKDNIVFGIVVNGIPKAYPKRILAWHEFFVDDFGGQKVAGVYCTLCGTVVAYNMTHDDVFHDLGTSGFLYQSNKLMYDKATQSLWSTLGGYPVVGPLVNKGIELEMYPVSTTTWGKWKTLYPNTTVLDVDTGFKRNYGEGEAYKDYYSNDNLMFPVNDLDSSLKNKDEVLVIRFSNGKSTQVPIKDLKKQNVFVDKDKNFVIISLDGEAYKVYEWHEGEIPNLVDQELQLASGKSYQIQEEQLITNDEIRKRIVSHRSFWFAWNNYKRALKNE